jgi:hypothetical protein
MNLSDLQHSHAALELVRNELNDLSEAAEALGNRRLSRRLEKIGEYANKVRLPEMVDNEVSVLAVLLSDFCEAYKAKSYVCPVTDKICFCDSQTFITTIKYQPSADHTAQVISFRMPISLWEYFQGDEVNCLDLIGTTYPKKEILCR